MPDAVAKDTPISFSSSYYLHPSDHPDLFICPVIFKGNNYDEWVITMQNSLCAKRKLGFIDMSLNPPDASETTPPTIDDWSIVNSMLVSWVIQSIDSSLRSSIKYLTMLRTYGMIFVNVFVLAMVHENYNFARRLHDVVNPD
ncbi:unnamed protein product [Rhodiola kirilowii]